MCGFRKVHSAQQALFRLLQSWQKELDNSGCVGTILVDLSKAYDYIQHDMLIAKLEEYRLDKTHVLESLFNKISGLKVCNFIRKKLQHRCFPVNIAKFLRTAFSIEDLRWLFLQKQDNVLSLLKIVKFHYLA